LFVFFILELATSICLCLALFCNSKHIFFTATEDPSEDIGVTLKVKRWLGLLGFHIIAVNKTLSHTHKRELIPPESMCLAHVFTLLHLHISICQSVMLGECLEQMAMQHQYNDHHGYHTL